MSFEIRRSLKESIQNSESVLIVSNQQNQVHYLHSALALAKVIRAMNKKVVTYYLPTNDVEFLADDERSLITNSTQCATDTRVVISVKDRSVQELKYEQSAEQLHIILTSDQEPIDPKDISIIPSGFAYDLVIALDVPSLEELEDLYKKNQAFFDKVSIISLSSEMLTPPSYAKLAWTHKESSSMAEMLHIMFKEAYQVNITNSVRQSLLTGLSQETQHLQSAGVTPRTLTIAAELMEHGAILPKVEEKKELDSDVSIPLPLTKLVGRLLAHLEYESEHPSLAFSKLYPHDFEKTGTIKEDLYTILPLLIKMCGDRDVVHIMIEGKSVKEGIIYDTRPPQTTYHKYQQFLDGELYRGAFRYSYPSPLNVHHACQEVNTIISRVLSGK